MPTEHQGLVPTEDRALRGQTAYKRALAYQHLGINQQEVERVPFLWPNLLNRGPVKDAS